MFLIFANSIINKHYFTMTTVLKFKTNIHVCNVAKITYLKKLGLISHKKKS